MLLTPQKPLTSQTLLTSKILVTTQILLIYQVQLICHIQRSSRIYCWILIFFPIDSYSTSSFACPIQIHAILRLPDIFVWRIGLRGEESHQVMYVMYGTELCRLPVWVNSSNHKMHNF